MAARPPHLLEWLIGPLVPPACREEVLGDLYERYRSPGRYLLDACSAVPLVIVSRIRRTVDPQVLLMEAFALYLAFLGATFLQDRTFLLEQNALLRLALPCVAALVGLLLEAAYTRPGTRPALQSVRGPVCGIFSAFLFDAWLRYDFASLAVPRWIILNGGAMSLLLLSAIHSLFPPLSTHPKPAAAPAFWLKLAGEPLVIPPGVAAVLRCLAAFSAVAIIGAWSGSSVLLTLMTAGVVFALILHELNRRV